MPSLLGGGGTVQAGPNALATCANKVAPRQGPEPRPLCPRVLPQIPRPSGHSQSTFRPATRRSLLRRDAQTGQHRQVAPDKMRSLPSSLCLLPDTIDNPGPDRLVVGFVQAFQEFLTPKTQERTNRNPFGDFFCGKFSRNTARSSSYDPQLSGVFPTIFNAFLAALRYTRRVVAAYALPSKAANSMTGFILSLYSLCFDVSKPQTEAASHPASAVLRDMPNSLSTSDLTSISWLHGYILAVWVSGLLGILIGCVTWKLVSSLGDRLCGYSFMYVVVSIYRSYCGRGAA